MIEVANLTKTFDNTAAVNNISLSIKSGELFGLLGPNGAGKTTFINMLTGLVKQDTGIIKINGVDIKRNTVETKKTIGFVPQELAFYKDLSAYENLKFFGGLYGLRKQQLKEAVSYALEFTGLIDSSKKTAKTFSGGMKRRLNIACGIVHKPKLIFMDEPTVGIDPQSRNHILRSVEKLQRSGCTIIYTTHYMEEAEDICSRIAIIDKGKIIAGGTKKELQQLIKDCSRVIISTKGIHQIKTEEIKKIQGVQQVDVQDSKTIITSDIDIHNINQIVAAFSSQEITISNIETDTPTLETVFLNLTGRKLQSGFSVLNIILP